ncbi:hypothetical protein C5167_037512 [Papaver somniferum]|uniref:Methyltransferase n=1 Tax=Papaver somniferum TaxID=3469 RepID=A0A4Y7I6X4_PAPSO|nr:hypothetical protein C5167_037512 [Papaver somniferum]
MAISKFGKNMKRPYGFCVKMTAVALLGLCFIFIWSTFSSSSSSLTYQRDSFGDIAEPAVANYKLSSKIHPKKSKHDDKEKVKSVWGDKDKKKEQRVVPPVITHHKEKDRKKVVEVIKPKEQDSGASNSTIEVEKSEEENSEKESDGEDEIDDNEGVDVEGENNGETGGEVGVEGQENGENIEDIENAESKKIGKVKKKLGPVFESNVQYTWKMCNVRSKYNYLPCTDVESSTGKLQIYRHHERSCPRTPPMCLVPLPPGGYDTPVPWPDSKLKVSYGNVEHPKLASFIKTQNWLMLSGEYLTFPSNQSEWKGGVLHYLDFIEEMVPDIEWGKNIRIVLDLGCMDSSFGATLLDKEVLALSLGLKDDLTDLAQIALERGGRLLLEINRILRPGGYFILSKKHDNIEDEASEASSLCS